MILMKRLIIFLILPYLLIGQNQSFDRAFAKAETSTYAKASSNCTLYKTQTMSNDIPNIYFIIPETYFVIILDKVSDECYKVQYDKFIGYVESSTIIIATFIPIIKTLDDITVDIKETSGTQIWNTPSTEGKILTTISAGFKNIDYIASCYGSIPSGGESNLWYYVSFTPSVNSTNVYEGYIYSENTINLTEIVANTESNPEIIQDNSIGNVLYLSSSLKTIIIVIITIPILIFILIILYKSAKKFKEFTNKRLLVNTNQSYQNYEKENNNQSNNYSFISKNNDHIDYENTHQNNLKDELLKMKNSNFVKKSNYHKNTNFPSFPDYNPDDDIL